MMVRDSSANGAGAAVHREKMPELVLNDPRYIMVLSLIVLIITMLIWWFFSRRRSARNSVLLTGVTESGKTLLFVRLIYSEFRQTFTSMKENVETYLTSNGSVRIIDIPGQERLRNRFFDQYKSNAKAIVFVVDSVTVQKDIRDVAEFLHTVLSERTVRDGALPMLVLCNKQDQPLAKGSQVVKALLEKEMNLVRMTKSSQLQSVDPTKSNAVVYLGKLGKEFEFSHLGNKVDFAECTALNDDEDSPVDIEALEKWIAKL